MLSESLHQAEGDQVGFEVDGPPPGADGHGLGCVAEAPHGADVRKERLGAGAFEAPAHPEHRVAVARHQQQSILHGAGEVVLVDSAQEGGQSPGGLGGVHPCPESLHPVGQLRAWNRCGHLAAATITRRPHASPRNNRHLALAGAGPAACHPKGASGTRCS